MSNETIDWAYVIATDRRSPQEMQSAMRFPKKIINMKYNK